MEPPYVSISGTKQRPSSLRLWQILTAVTSLVAVVMTALFIWYVLTNKTNQAQASDATDTNPAMLACPQLPTLFPLSLKPLPKRITRVFENLTAVLSSLVDKKASLPAISMNVFYQDDILWSGHFGSKVYQEKQNKPDDNTVYRIGSVTKIFAVLLVFKLYEEGKIASIDDPLSKYSPGFEIKNPFTNEDITLREIASQMSGLPREAPCLYHCNTTSTEQLALLKNRTLVLPPWTMPTYSNLGYGLLGRLLTENLLNVTFETWTTENILKPLGMSNTGFEITAEVEKNMAFPYLPGGERMPFMDIGWLAPAGQMYSTINDLAKLGMMFAQPSKQKLFKPATLREMMTPKDITPDGVTVWGSPFEMAFKRHFLVRGKGGNIDSYAATFSIIPELALGANILISTVFYVQTPTFQGTSLYNDLIPALNKTLFELQSQEHFPIDPTPYTGQFVVNVTNPITKKTITFLAAIKSYQNVLHLEDSHKPTPYIHAQIKYIGERLVFQANKRTPGMTCLTERIGLLAGLYFDAPGKDGLSYGFKIPEWVTVGKRVTSQDEIQAPIGGFHEDFEAFWQMKSAI